MKKGQIWVETVVYTLIILVIIGILLSILQPVINKKKDQMLLQQSLRMMNEINNAVEDARYYGGGNSIPVDIELKKGQLKVIPLKDEISFTVRSEYVYSEINKTISKGKINITTLQKLNEYEISFVTSFAGKINVTYNGKEDEKVINPAPSPFKMYITNLGRNTSTELVKIDFNI